MKKIILPCAILLVIAGGLIASLKIGQTPLSAKLEVLNVSESGEVKLKLTNTGGKVFFDGYSADGPLMMVDILDSNGWIKGRGPFCGTGLSYHLLEAEESKIFTYTVNPDLDKPFRLSVILSDTDFFSRKWYDEILEYFNIVKKYEQVEVHSKTIMLP